MSTLRRFDRLRDIAAGLDDATAADQIDQEAWGLIDEQEPMRLSVAAEALGVSYNAVRAWIDHDALDEVDAEQSVRRVSFASVAELREVLAELRELGQDRNLLAAAVTRLESDAISKSHRFRESVEQMKRGERAQ